MGKIAIGIIGAGRMSQELLKKINQSPHFSLASVFSRQKMECPEYVPTLFQVFKESSVVIDFSHHSLLENILQQATEYKKPLVIGVTGLHSFHYQQLTETAQQVPIVYSANMSIGIALLKKAAAYFSKKLDDSFDRDLTEFHHRYKKDFPSGTSLALARCIADNPNLSIEDLHTTSLTSRQKGRIGISAVHAGGVLADQQVYFTSDTEQIMLSHRCLDRCVYAEGALKAAQWIINKKPALYSMEDVLGLSEWIV